MVNANTWDRMLPNGTVLETIFEYSGGNVTRKEKVANNVIDKT